MEIIALALTPTTRNEVIHERAERRQRIIINETSATKQPQIIPPIG
jgi:hypothetical protein